MLLASIIIYLLFTLFLYPRIFEKATISKIILVFYVSVFSINVLTCEFLSLFNWLNHPWLYLTIQTLFCIIISLVIQRLFPISINSIVSVFDYSKFKISKTQIFLVASISAVFIGFFAVGISTPINNTDSLATHLPRIYYWLQQGSLDYWTQLSALNRYQLIYPFNAHLQGLWLFLMGHNENLFFLVQWFSLITITASIFEISKSLGFSSNQSLVTSIISLSFPAVLLQTFSFQGDMTVTALVMVFIVSLFLFQQSKKLKFVWLGVFSLVLAVGTKQTAFFILPIAGLVTLGLLIKSQNFLRFIKYSWLVIVLVVIFSSYQYILNFIHTGSIFGLEAVLNEKYTSVTQIADKSKYLIPRFTYQFISVDGLPRSIQPRIINIKENIFSGVLNSVGLDLENEKYLQAGFDEVESFQYNAIPKLTEDTAWFGPMAFLLIPLSTIILLFNKDNKRRLYAVFCLVNSMVYMILVILQRPGWDPYQGRYFILSLSPFIPMISIVLPNRKVLNKIVSGFLVLFSFLLIANTLLNNDAKPILTSKTQNDIINNLIAPLPEENSLQLFFKKVLLKFTYPTAYSSKLVNIYEATYYDQLFYSSVYTAKDILWINKMIPAGDPISILIHRSPIEYGLFGKNRSRLVYSISSINDAQPGYVLISNDKGNPNLSNMRLIGKNDGYSIFYNEEK